MQHNQLNRNEKDNPALSKMIARNIRTVVPDELGIIDHENSELADLEMETKPEDVLAEVHRPQAIELSKRVPL